MATFKKQYKLVMHENLVKLENIVYFEINHEGWVPLGGAFFVDAPGWDSRWYQTLWLPEPFWKEELLVEEDTLLGAKKENVGIPRKEEEPEIFRDD